MVNSSPSLQVRREANIQMRASEQKKTTTAGEKGRVKFAERKRVLKRGSDADVVAAFANKKGKPK